MAKLISQKKLELLISSGGVDPGSFALFLGAGASISSGVRPASDMIEEWRKTHFQVNRDGDETEEEHWKRYAWYGRASEYGELFESLFDHAAQRRDYIESYIEGSSPFWGYIYLVNLILRGYFNAIFTTNFDDLVNETCSMFRSVEKPLVCAHDSSVSSVRVLSKRPKVIKLHGDFLFENIKNTGEETRDLSHNMTQKFKEFAREYGLIVVGYGGQDSSVMDILKELLKEKDNFKNGIYWCVLDKDTIPDKVQELQDFPRFSVVEIEGFDEFMAELHESLKLELQPELSVPYETLAEGLQELLSFVTTKPGEKLHNLIDRDMKRLDEGLRTIPPKVVSEQVDFSKVAGFQFKVGPVDVRIKMPYALIGDAHEVSGNTEEALKFMKLQIKHAPNPTAFENSFRILKKHGLDNTEYAEFADLLRENTKMFSDSPGQALSLALALMELGKYSDAKWVLDKGEKAFKASGDPNPISAAYFQLNRMQIKLHLGRALSEKEHEALTKIRTIDSPYTKMAVAILREKWSEAETQLDLCLKTGPGPRRGINSWPIIQLLRPHIKNSRIKTRLEASK